MSPRHSLVTFASLATFAVLVAGAAPALHAQGDSTGGKGRGSARVAGKGALATGAVSATCNDGSTFRGDSRSGEGLLIHVAPDDTMFLAWFTHRP